MATALASSSPASADQGQTPATRSFRLTPSTDAAPLNPFANLMRFSEPKRNQALWRSYCVDELRKGRAEGRLPMGEVVRRVINDALRRFPDLKISRASLFKWDKKKCIDSDIVSLVDDRGGDMKHEGDIEAWDVFRDLYLHENQPSIRFCWHEVRQLAAQRRWNWCGYDACCRQLDKRIPPQDQTASRQPAIYRQRLAPYTSQAPESWAAGERYTSDHKQFDLICRWEKTLVRPWLTPFMDWRTRKICGWVLSDNPNSTTILAALRHALMNPSNLGGPSEVIFDNGRDFDCWMFHGQTKQERRARISPKVDEGKTAGILKALGIETHFAIPFNPNAKSRIERWFGTLTPIFKSFKTYTGDSIENKPEQLNDILKNHRNIPSFEEVKRRVGDFIAGYNNRADHQIDDLSEDGLTLSPSEAYAKWCPTKRIMADPAALDLLLQHWHRPVPVGRNGISITLAGRKWHYGQFSPELAPFKAERQEKRRLVNISYDPNAVESIRVFDESMRFICVAEMNVEGGASGRISKDNLKTQARNRAVYDRSCKAVTEHSLTSVLTPEEQAAIIADDEQSKKHAEEHRSMRIVQTHMDNQNLNFAGVAENAAQSRPSIRTPSQILRHSEPRERDEESLPRPDGLARLRKRYAEVSNAG